MDKGKKRAKRKLSESFSKEQGTRTKRLKTESRIKSVSRLDKTQHETLKRGQMENSKKRKSPSSTEVPPSSANVHKKPKTHKSSSSVSDVKKNQKGQLIFEDFEDFRPNMTPKDILQAGSFGGTYFRPIYSRITKQHYKDEWKELPEDWLSGLDISKQVASSTYRPNVNTYKVKCGGSLEMWESSGWIIPQDPYGWFQWYCRFYIGRRTEDDRRQVGRWMKCAGVKGRWRNNLITKVVRSGCEFNDLSVSPVVRQTLQHWGYRLTKEDYTEGAKRVNPK